MRALRSMRTGANKLMIVAGWWLVTVGHIIHSPRDIMKKMTPIIRVPISRLMQQQHFSNLLQCDIMLVCCVPPHFNLRFSIPMLINSWFQ